VPGARQHAPRGHRPYYHGFLHRLHDSVLDAHLIKLMGFRSNVRRMPFTELGCAAGAMGLSRAADFYRVESRQ